MPYLSWYILSVRRRAGSTAFSILSFSLGRVPPGPGVGVTPEWSAAMPPQSGSGRGAGSGRTQRGPSLGRGGGSASPKASPFGTAPATHAPKAASQAGVTAPPSPFASASTGASLAAPPTPTPAHEQTLHAPGAAGTSGPPLEDLGALGVVGGRQSMRRNILQSFKCSGGISPRFWLEACWELVG